MAIFLDQSLYLNCIDKIHKWFILLTVSVLALCVLFECHSLSEVLSEWDSRLTEALVHPQPLQGGQLLTNMDDYTCVLWEVRDEIRRLNLSVIEDMRCALSTRLPQFIRTYKKVNKPAMYKVFNWTDREEKRLSYLILDSKHLWKTTTELHEKKLKEVIQPCTEHLQSNLSTDY